MLKLTRSEEEPDDINAILEANKLSITEIEHVLKGIRNICQSIRYCSACPFRTYNGDDCKFRSEPSDWKFASEPDEGVARIFK